jgi:hypothetical protein
LLGDLLAQFAFRIEEAAIHHFERFVLLGFGQRSLPQAVEREPIILLNEQFSIAPLRASSARRPDAVSSGCKPSVQLYRMPLENWRRLP